MSAITNRQRYHGGPALRRHGLAKLLEHAHSHHASALPGRNAFRAAPLLRVAKRELASLPCVPELRAEAGNLLGSPAGGGPGGSRATASVLPLAESALVIMPGAPPS